MGLASGKTAWVDAMVQADKDFVAEYGGTMDAAAEPRLRTKYEKQYDILVSAITGNAVVLSNNPPFSPIGTIQ